MRLRGKKRKCVPAVSSQTAQEIDLDAADWAARVDRGLSPDEELGLDAWLAGDPRRVGAYGRVRAISLHTERARALGPNFNRASFGQPSAFLSPSRRLLLLAGAGGAVAAGIAGVAVVGLGLNGRGAHYATRLGEVNVVPLADGSVMTLNTASIAEVLFTEARRTVRLIQGEALFDVAKDASRPFVVEAGETLVRAIGTSFTVSRFANAPVQVLVREGVVELSPRAAPASVPPMQVEANTRAVAPAVHGAAMTATTVAPSEIGRLLAWREGRIAFEGETLAQAVQQFARYSETHIIIDDTAIASEQITGLFQANDPVGFAQAIASSFDLHAEVGAGEVRLRRRA
jgi:transmembrane sensor